MNPADRFTVRPKDAGELLGGLNARTIYRMVNDGTLDRAIVHVPGIKGIQLDVTRLLEIKNEWREIK